jgi:hypothetical protein
MPNRTTFGEFLWSEIRKRSMSAREFADFVGVTHTVINKFLNYGTSETYSGRPIGYPSVEFLTKLALATHTDICYLMLLVEPSLPHTGQLSPDAMITSQRIEQLPDQVREIIDDIIIKHAKVDQSK